MDFLLREQELDRVLDGEDVAGHLLVAPLDHRRQRRALAGAGGADHQDQAALFQHQLRQQRRQAQRVQRRDVERDAAEHRRDRAALLEGRQAEAAHARQADADVELAGVVAAPPAAAASAARPAAGASAGCVSSWSDSCRIWPLILIRIGVLADR